MCVNFATPIRVPSFFSFWKRVFFAVFSFLSDCWHKNIFIVKRKTMKLLNPRLKKIILWTLASIVLLVALTIVFISPIAKHLVEKYDVKYTGREITMDLPYINVFTGNVHLRNIKVFENKSDSVFFSARGIHVNFEMFKMLSKTYEISSLTLKEPVVKVIQQDSLHFNFTDLIEKFASQDTTPKAPKAPVHFNIMDLKIKDGTFYYIEKTIPVFYYVEKVNIDSPGKKWDQDTVLVNYALESGVGSGTLKGDAVVNVSSMDYKLKAKLDKFDLSVLEQYVRGIANYGKFRANMDADLKASGNIKNNQQLNASGTIAINDMHFGKDTTEDYASFRKLTVAIRQLSPAGKKYSFDSISLARPYFKYERYDHLDNLQNMFGQNGENVKEAKAQRKVNILFQIADYVAALAKNFFKSNFKINRLAVYNSDFVYNDYSLTEKFGVATDPLTLVADSIERSDKWVDLTLKAGLKPYGDMNFGLRINPKDSSDFDLDYHLQKVPLALFNPYLITFTSFPLDRGTLELKGHWQVRNGYINSDNRLTLVDTRINRRQKRNGARWIPLRAIMFLVRDRGNVTDFEVPVKGNLNDPKFKFRDVIMDVLTNVFVKPVTTPYRTQVRYAENEIENSLTVRWDKRKSELEPDQEEFVEKMAGFLEDHPHVNITVSPLMYTEKEKEYILFFEAKKQFYLAEKNKQAKHLTKDDTTEIEKISVKDSLFIHYLNKHVRNNLVFTVQEKCFELVGSQRVDVLYNKLLQRRKEVFLSYFKKEGVQQHVQILAAQNKVPFNGFSIYRINYKGEVPDDLIEAYRTINAFDNRNPRKKYKELRKKERAASRGN